MAKQSITLKHYDPSTSPPDLLSSIIDMHIACIQHDNSLLRFHPPFNHQKRTQMTTFWEARLATARTSESTLLLAFLDDTLCGIGELLTPTADTGSFRAGVEMVMTSPSHQGKGIAKTIMKGIEDLALEKGRTLLRLGTTKGSVADLYLYPKLGYVRIGEVPGYGIEPVTGRLVDGVEYYKHLKTVV